MRNPIHRGLVWVQVFEILRLSSQSANNEGVQGCGDYQVLIERSSQKPLSTAALHGSDSPPMIQMMANNLHSFSSHADTKHVYVRLIQQSQKQVNIIKQTETRLKQY